MNRTLWTVLGIIATVLIAWFIISVLFSVLWFIARIAIVAVVVIVGLLALRSLAARRNDDRRSIGR